MIFSSIVHACITLRVIFRNPLYILKSFVCIMHIIPYKFWLSIVPIEVCKYQIVPISLPKILYNKSVFIDISGSCSLCSGSGLPNQ